MLDVIYYPVSAVLWFWHKIFGDALGLDSGLVWVLAVVFLVFTIRLLVVRSSIAQMRMQLRMRTIRPQMEALRKKHADDGQRLLTETRKLHAEHGIKPFVGFPILPVAVLVYWVSSNIWTFGQQHLLWRRLDREQAALTTRPTST